MKWGICLVRLDLKAYYIKRTNEQPRFCLQNQNCLVREPRAVFTRPPREALSESLSLSRFTSCLE